MRLSPETLQAVNVWHERIGRWIGAHDAAKSIGGAYPMRTSSGRVKPNRIGAGAPSAILIDANDAIVVERLDVASIASLDGAPVRVMSGHPGSLRKGVMSWLLDPRRVYPMLVVMPGKASVLSALRLSRVPNQVFVCEPGSTIAFDAVKVLKARDQVLARSPDDLAQWRKATRLRSQVSQPSFAGESASAKNHLLKKYAESLQVFPLDVWLPQEGSAEHWALSEALIAKDAMNFEVIPKEVNHVL